MAGSWWDWSDWGGTGWAEDVTKAEAQAQTWLASVATAKTWSSTAQAQVKGYIKAAADGASDATAFWRALDKAYKAGPPTATNADKLGATFASAAGTAATTATGRDQGSASTILGGTVAGAVEDVAEAAEAAGEAASLLKSPVTWVVLALGAVALAARR